MTLSREAPLDPPREQDAFFFYKSTVLPRPATKQEVVALGDFLRGRGWVRAAVLIVAKPPGVLLPDGIEDAKRKLRLIAEAGDGAILAFPGSRGYCVLSEADTEDIHRCIRSHRSQSRKHIRRVRAAVIELKRRRAAEEAALAALTPAR